MRRLAFLALLVSACSNGGGVPLTQVGSFTTLGDVADAIEAAEGTPDSDGDSIPDSVELELGTDPHHKDTDRDGLVDNYELFGDDYHPSDPLPDVDRDQDIAPVDQDDDGDLVNDGMTVDSDGDGVPNYFEYYGYSYDFLTGRFVAWDGDPAKPHFFTDPLQASTDQDAYPDGMEVSTLLLDPTVQAPGDDPLVPAYPNIVCELYSYTVTLNEDIEITESESLSEGQSWTRQTDQTHSFGVQTAWEVGAEYTFGPTGGWKVSGKFGQTYENTHSTTTSFATGESVTRDEGWSVARSSNPTEAAQLKLFVKVKNRGTAPISNLVPTLNLKIGGLSVATFEPGGAPVQLLVPGATYPAEAEAYWVVGPLTLTMTELRALERGAPVSLAIVQIQGDAMRLAPGGVWESVGDTTEFSARCDAVCANIRIEMENGDLVHHLVYADDSPSAPPMTLGDALAKLGVDEDGTLVYFDPNGTPIVQSLDDFHMAVDPPTLRANGWTFEADGDAETGGPPDFMIMDMLLLPASNIYLRAPRGPGEPATPVIHFAYLDPQDGEIRVSADDYEGVVGVTVRNEDGSQTQQLQEDLPGAGFYSGNALGENGFEPGQVLTVEVENLAGNVTAQELGTLFTDPDPVAPAIHAVEVDLDAKRLYANVESGNPGHANSEILWVRAFHPSFSGGYDDMPPVIDYFRDPNGFALDLPVGFDTSEPVEVVAYVGPGVWSSLVVEPADFAMVQIRRQGTIKLTAWADQAPITDKVEWRMHSLNLDAAKGASWTQTPAPFQFAPPPPPGLPWDLTLYMAGPSPFSWGYVHWNAHYAKVSGGLGTYRTMTRDDIYDQFSAMDDAVQQVGTDDEPGLKVGDVLAVKTNSGNLPAKLYVEAIVYDSSIVGEWAQVELTLRYVVFEAE